MTSSTSSRSSSLNSSSSSSSPPHGSPPRTPPPVDSSSMRNTPLLRTPMSQGSDHDSTNRGHSQGVSVEYIHPGIARDLSAHNASCSVNDMLQYTLHDTLTPGEEQDSTSLFSDVLAAVIPIANKVRPLVESYCAYASLEIDRYEPFIKLVNAILKETGLQELVDGSLNKYNFRPPALGLLAHRNAAKPIFGHYDNSKTKIIPAVVFTSLSAALRDSDEYFMTWDEYINCSSVLETPRHNFCWIDALGSLKFKLQKHELLAPPEQYTSKGSTNIPAVDDYTLEVLPTAPMFDAVPPKPSSKAPQPSKRPVSAPATASTSTHIMELSPNTRTQRPERKRGPPIVQTAMYAAERLGAGVASTHVFNLLIADHILWIWYYDREGCIQTSGIDFVQDLPRLVLLLFSLQRFELEHWGFHPQLDVLAHHIHRNPAQIDPQFLENVQLFVEHKTGGNAGSALSMQTLITFADGKSVKVDLRNWQPIHQRHGLCGRATQVLAVSETQSNDIPDAERFVLKVYWPDVARVSEPQIIELAYDVCSQDPNVVEHLPYVFGSRDDSAFSTHHIRTALNIRPTSRSHRTLRIIAFEELFRVQDQPTAQIGMTMILEAVKCHYGLWLQGVQHTDISLDNIMVRKRRLPNNEAPRLIGVVNDWDLASTPDVEHVILERTGTIPFMHPELLVPEYWEGKVPRLYLHDNTSFIWVMAFLFLRYANGKILTSPTLPLDDLITNDYKQARQIKNDIKTKLTSFVCAPNATNEWEIVIELLLWTSNSRSDRDDAKIRARNDPSKLRDLLHNDDSLGVYTQFWDRVQAGAETVGVEYISDILPGKNQLPAVFQ